MVEQQDEQSVSINDVEYYPVNHQIKESLRVQKTEYMRQQLRKRQEQEDALMVKLMQEQRIIDSMREQIDEKLEQSDEVTRFNQEMQKTLNKQVYELHGVSEDKIEGIQEYKNAYYRGCAFGLFLMSVALSIFAGVLHGFDSEICMFQLVYTGLEGALLAQDGKRWKIVDMLCKGLNLFLFPVMFVMFILHELDFLEYGLALPYVNIAAVVLAVLATASYFFHDPYRSAKENVKKARSHMEQIERQARKEVKKNTKQRAKEEKKEQKKMRKEEKREERRIRREGRFSLFRWLKNSWTSFLGLFSKKKAEEYNEIPEETEELEKESEDQEEEFKKQAEETEELKNESVV